MNDKLLIKSLKLFNNSISSDFNEATKIKIIKKDPPLAEWPKEWTEVFYKGYPRFSAYQLPQPLEKSSISLIDALKDRRSSRSYSKEPILSQDLSTLLYYSFGVMNKDKKRFYPSAGGRYSLEVYPLIINVKDINPGIYHYYVKNNLLEILPKKRNLKKQALTYFGNESWSKNLSAMLVVSAVFSRTKIKYGERGYRHVLTELGSAMQNIYLLCAMLNIGCCPTGAYVDDGFNKIIDIDGTEESVIGVIGLGKKL